jgi:hypothetical protein
MFNSGGMPMPKIKMAFPSTLGFWIVILLSSFSVLAAPEAGTIGVPATEHRPWHPPREVLAFYYPWHGPTRHWGRRWEIPAIDTCN